MTRIQVDLDLCQGHGRCYRFAPDVMEPFDDHGHAAFVEGSLDDADADRLAKAQKAVASCPESALSEL